MSQQSSQSQITPRTSLAVPGSSPPSIAPALIPPNGLTGKRLVFTSPVASIQASGNPAVGPLRLLLSRSETTFEKLSSKLDDLASSVKYGQKEIAELNQIQQDDLAEVKRDLQEHVSRAQVAIQSSLGGEQQSLKNDIHDALASLSGRLDHTLSMFSGLQEVLSAQSREYKTLREHLELITKEITFASNKVKNAEEPRSEFDGRFRALRNELLESIHSEFSSLSEKLLTATAYPSKSTEPAFSASTVHEMHPSFPLDLHLGTMSTYPTSTDATVVNHLSSPRLPQIKAPGTSLECQTEIIAGKKLCESVFELQEIDFPPTQPTAYPPMDSSGSRTLTSSEHSVQRPDREVRKVLPHSHRLKTLILPPPTYSNHWRSSRQPNATPKRRYRRIRTIDDEAIGGLPPVDGFT